LFVAGSSEIMDGSELFVTGSSEIMIDSEPFTYYLSFFQARLGSLS